MTHLVITRRAVSVVALIALAGCGRGDTNTQSFTRQVPATTAAIVGSAVTTFSNHGISVAVADEPGGKVRTAPVNLRGSLALGSPDDRVACPAAAGGTTGPPDTGPVTVTFQIKVKPVPDGSIVSLEARRENAGSGCVVKSTFVAQLLEEIIQGARHS
jgi:hypothetical protein